MVIAVLAGLVAPNVFKHVGEAKSVTARSQIEMLGAALDAYRLDNGRYPATDQGLGALWQAPLQEPRPVTWRGPYLRKEVAARSVGPPVHPIRAPASRTPPVTTLVSYSADGQPGGEGEAADVLSWK